MENMTTLRKALTQAKCSVPCKIQCRNTRGTDWPKLKDEETQFSHIYAWDEFTIENLNSSYGHILDAPIPEGELGVPVGSTLALATVEITRPEHINHLLRCCDGVLVPALEFARARMNLETGTSLKSSVAHPDRAGGAPAPRIPKMHNKGAGIKLDHLVELDEFRLPTLVVGLGRPSRSFRGRNLVDGAREETLWPLRQLANLCLNSQTRFGYILTDEDLVACYFTATNPRGAASSWSVAVRPVPWTKSGEGQLTTDLALWWLAMLAISSPGNRALVEPGFAIGIDQWCECPPGDDRGWVRRHWYSGREEPIDAPAPPAYQAPSPGNAVGQAAAAAAGVGINADPAFEPRPQAAPAADNNAGLANFNFDAFVAENNA